MKRKLNSSEKVEKDDSAQLSDEFCAPLLLAIVQGNENEAQRLLEMNPHLLYNTKGEVTDYSNRAIKNLTPFQAALCAGDVEMCEMMAKYFLQLKDGQAELQSQFDAIFPNGLEAHIQTQQENVFDFNEILQAISNAHDGVISALDGFFAENLVPLHQALEKFRQAFTEKSLSETVFNPYHFLKAFQTYADNFRNLELNKRFLFVDQVIGFTQRYLPACYLQAFEQGLHHIVKYKEAFRRSDLTNLTCFRYLPRSGLGFDYALSPDGQEGSPVWAPERAACLCQDYVQKKQKAFEKLRSLSLQELNSNKEHEKHEEFLLELHKFINNIIVEKEHVELLFSSKHVNNENIDNIIVEKDDSVQQQTRSCVIL